MPDRELPLYQPRSIKCVQGLRWHNHNKSGSRDDGWHARPGCDAPSGAASWMALTAAPPTAVAPARAPAQQVRPAPVHSFDIASSLSSLCEQARGPHSGGQCALAESHTGSVVTGMSNAKATRWAGDTSIEDLFRDVRSCFTSSRTQSPVYISQEI